MYYLDRIRTVPFNFCVIILTTALPPGSFNVVSRLMSPGVAVVRPFFCVSVSMSSVLMVFTSLRSVSYGCMRDFDLGLGGWDAFWSNMKNKLEVHTSTF